MNESRISVRYSRALFKSALDSKILDIVDTDMHMVQEICRIGEIREILANPVIVPSKKMEILHSLFEKNVHKITMAMIDLVVRNGRETYLPAIARVFIHETLKHKGITESVLTTAVKVEPAVRKQVTDLIEKAFKTKAILSENIDETIIGGFILRVDDSYIDASIRNKLRKIRKNLLSGTFGSRN